MPHRLGDWLKIAGGLRDGFLVTAGICYFFGYIVWAINAKNNDMGLLPALDFQYFVAGAPTVVVILALYYIFTGFKRLKEEVQGRIGPDPTGGVLFLCWFIVVLGLLAYIALLINTMGWFKALFPSLWHSRWLGYFSPIIIVVSRLFVPPLKEAPPPRQELTHILYPEERAPKPDKSTEECSKQATETSGKRTSEQLSFKQLVWNAFESIARLILEFAGAAFAIIIFVGLAVLAFVYVLELYPRIPQEFGGARPRYACLDVVKTQLASETIEALLPTSESKPNEQVVRSSKVEVLFSGSDLMLVRSPQKKVYRITKSAIHAVSPCD